MAYVVAIPTYQRYDMLNRKTLKMLREGGVPSSLIYIFVANEEEKIKYEEKTDRNEYNEMIVGILGIREQTNFITKYFPEETCIVVCSDDVGGLYCLSDKLNLISDVDEFFEGAFHECQDKNLFLWGIYPVMNHLFMKNHISYDLRFIHGTLYGYINRHDEDLDVILVEKEDVERSIRYYIKDGGVIRFNYVAMRTYCFKNKGGLGLRKDRIKTHEECAKRLKEMYPSFGKIWHRKNGMPEFRLKIH
jgi:hypothetical protein